MKYFILTIAFIIVSSFSRGSFQEDTLKVKDSVMPISVVAMDKTDKKVDSIFSTASGAITVSQFNEGLAGMMKHMDTLHIAGLILMRQRDSIDNVRHLEYVAKMNVIDMNTRLRKENERLERTKKWAEKGSHVLILFFTVFAAIKFSQGLDIGFRKMKNADR